MKRIDGELITIAFLTAIGVAGIAGGIIGLLVAGLWWAIVAFLILVAVCYKVLEWSSP